MSIKKHILLLLFITLFLFPAGKGADIAFLTDTTSIKVRLPDAKHIAGYRDQKSFDYQQKIGNYSLQKMLQRWIFNKIGYLFKLFNHAGSIELFLAILIVLAIIAIILKINNINPIALFRQKDHILQPSFNIGNENIADMNFPVLIEQAIKQQNYRLAVRYHYLQTLAMLAMAGKIQPGDEKTNRQYLSELGSGETRLIFAQLVYGFEYIWYGEFIPDEKQYFIVSSAFIEFKKSLEV